MLLDDDDDDDDDDDEEEKEENNSDDEVRTIKTIVKSHFQSNLLTSKHTNG